MLNLALRIGLPVLAVLAIAGGFYFLKVNLDKAKSDAALYKERAGYFSDALNAYRGTFESQMESLNAEKRAEIQRHENFLKTLNLIGENAGNETVPDSQILLLDSLYGAGAN